MECRVGQPWVLDIPFLLVEVADPDPGRGQGQESAVGLGHQRVVRQIDLLEGRGRR